MLDWLPERDPQVQVLNFLDSNGLLPPRCLYWIGNKILYYIGSIFTFAYNLFSFSFFVRDQPQRVVEFLPPPPTSLHEQNMNLDDHMSPRSGLVDNTNVQRPEFGQVIDVNLSPWAEFYRRGT
jgi:hypothetical protein